MRSDLIIPMNYGRLYALSGAIYQLASLIPFPDCILENMVCPRRTYDEELRREGRAEQVPIANIL